MLVFSLVVLVVAKPDPAAFWMGLPLVAAGEAIRIWSAGYLTKLSGLVTAGPFALCRNPLYVGSFLISLGYLVMCDRPYVLIAGIVVFWVLHGGAVVYEERLLRERFGAEFDDYCRRVPRFLPRLGRLAGNGAFSFRRVVTNDEHRQAVSAVALLSVFAWMAYESFSILDWLVELR